MNTPLVRPPNPRLSLRSKPVRQRPPAGEKSLLSSHKDGADSHTPGRHVADGGGTHPYKPSVGLSKMQDIVRLREHTSFYLGGAYRSSTWVYIFCVRLDARICLGVSLSLHPLMVAGALVHRPYGVCRLFKAETGR